MFKKLFKSKNEDTVESNINIGNTTEKIKEYIMLLREYNWEYEKDKNYSSCGAACDWERKLHYKPGMIDYLISSQELFNKIYKIIDNKNMEETILKLYLSELRSEKFIDNKYDLSLIKSTYEKTITKRDNNVTNLTYILTLFSDYVNNNHDSCSKDIIEIYEKLPGHIKFYVSYKDDMEILHKCCTDLLKIEDNKYSNMIKKIYNSPENTIEFLIEYIDTQKEEMDKIQKEYESCIYHVDKIFECINV